MNNELERLWKQPTFENLDGGIRLVPGDDVAPLHSAFVIFLFITSNALPMKASAETLKLETARKVVALYHHKAEAAWHAQGFITKWSSDCLEGIARELAERLARNPAVVNAVAEKLERRRDVVFADHSLTHGDAMFVVDKYATANAPDMFREMLEEDCIEVIREDAIVTINRALDHLKDLRPTKELSHLIRLRRILYSLIRVYAVVLGD